MQVAEKVIEHPKALLPASSRLYALFDKAFAKQVLKAVGTLLLSSPRRLCASRREALVFVGRRVTMRAIKGALIALPLLGSGLCFEACWSETKRARKERADAGDKLVGNLFASAAALDGMNGVVGLAEATILWKHRNEHRGPDEAGAVAHVCDVPIPEVHVPAHPLHAAWQAVEHSLEWAELNPAFVYAGPVLAIAATAVAVAAEVLSQQRRHTHGDVEEHLS